ncbi:hypothetical protein VIBNISFn118_910028 [Vibrio nigripulchritudo SFn118]|nr:hypothetical protein VIBNISFn118_910028 [Vibrio nigripulchritudo SFn118]
MVFWRNITIEDPTGLNQKLKTRHENHFYSPLGNHMR